MKRNSILFGILVLLTSVTLLAQKQEFAALGIPKELKNNANAVIRSESMRVVVNDIDELSTQYRYVVTLLNKAGHRQYANAVSYYDDDTKIKKISAVIYDAMGNEIKKYSKNKFTDVSAVSGGSLYQDDRVLFVDYTPITYPYTLEFEVEKTTKTTGFIPGWRPVRSYYASVQQSSYTFENRTKSEIRIKEKNFEGADIQKINTKKGFVYRAENLSAVKFESLAPYIRTLQPELKLALTDFSLKGVRGTAKDWQQFGKWMHDALLNGRSQLPASTKYTILSLVEGVNDPLKKAKIVYKFVQNKTRYISVQVGIGGWEPIAANQVDKVGYGDCKGLTNYTKALLEVVGVPSYYTVVHADRKYSMEANFASIEGNHVILNVPIDGEDIWLECTSQTIPFGFLGDFTDDRDVLVVTPTGGVIKRTASYVNEGNLQKTTAQIELDSLGTLQAEIQIVSSGIEYDKKFSLANESLAAQKKYYQTNRWTYHNGIEASNIAVVNDIDSLQLREQLTVKIPNYAKKASDELLFQVNAFSRNRFVPKRYRSRKLPLHISRGYKHQDRYEIQIPKGYSVVGLPPPKRFSNQFGSYLFRISQKDKSTLVFEKELLIKKGTYPKEDYAAYRKFRKTIARYENLRLSLAR